MNASMLDVGKGNNNTAVPMKQPGMSKEDIILAKLENLSTDVKALATVKEDVQVLGNRKS